MKKKSPRCPITASSLQRAFCVFATVCFLGIASPGFSQLELLKDVDRTEDPVFNEYSLFTYAGNHMYFVSNNELWKSNGTTKYTLKMKAFKAISNLTMVGQTLFFSADDGISGLELWKSDGAPGRTVKVKDIKPGAGSSSPSHLTNVNGIVYFAANTADKGTELWRSDGTEAGTFMVRDISRGSANPRNLVNFNGTLYFVATSPSGYELWKSHGATTNTVLVKDIVAGPGSSNPALLTVSNNKLFFVAMQPATGIELWISDGTTSGTKLLKDILPGTRTSAPENLIHANGRLMFTANDGVHGDELWSSNGTGTGTMLVKDMNPGPGGSNSTDSFLGAPMGQFANINGLLYFIAAKGTRGYIYRSDGSEGGTVIITEAFGIMANEPQPEFTYRNGYVYFFNAHPDNDYIYSLYKMPFKGKVITRIKNFEAEPDDYHRQLDNQMLYLNGAVFFPARFSTEYRIYGGYELIRSDGTPEGTVAIHDTYAPTMSSHPREMITLNGRVYSLHYSWISYTPQLYSTDGTPEGTFELRPERYHYEWEPVGDELYFSEEDFIEGAYRWQLSKTRGTPATTHVVTYGPARDENNVPRGLTDVNGILYYFNGRGEVYRSDGTTAGTQMIADLYNVISITNVNGQAFILAPNNIDQLVLWKANSQGGLTQVAYRDDAIAPEYYIEDAAMEVGGIFYFLVSEGGQSHQIWRSNGTAAGTYKMFGPGGFQGEPLLPGFSQITLLELNDHLYFSDGTALYRTTGETYTKVQDLPRIVNYAAFKGKLILFTGDQDHHVFSSDGTPEGTTLLTYRSNVEYYFYTDYAIAGDNLYFNSIYSPELYRTDGTACGTTIVDVGAGSPFALEGIGNDLVFGGYKHETGTELYVYHNVNSIPGDECQESVLAAQLAGDNQKASKIMASYPNPFTDSFTLKVDGKEDDIAEVAVYTGSGLPVELLKDVAVNREHSNIGVHWPRGLYIIKVRTHSKVEVFQVLKE